jgi:hypothetical protein
MPIRSAVTVAAKVDAMNPRASCPHPGTGRHPLRVRGGAGVGRPADPEDLKQAHALQDSLTTSQRSVGSFEVPNWDRASQKKVQEALLVLGSTLPDLRKGGGSRDEVDPVRHLIATAAGWGLNPDKDAI